MGRARHRLVLADRGLNHVHRWAPSCSCGRWVGVFRRRKNEAVAEYRDHIGSQMDSIKGRRRLPEPQALTPPEDWPPEWHTSVAPVV